MNSIPPPYPVPLSPNPPLNILSIPPSGSRTTNSARGQEKQLESGSSRQHRPDTCPIPPLMAIRINQANQHKSRASNRWGGDPGAGSAAADLQPVGGGLRLIPTLQATSGRLSAQEPASGPRRNQRKAASVQAKQPSGGLFPAAVLNSASARARRNT